MSYLICTLYERKYHFGVAALINSLGSNGFKGSFYIGYRGNLPQWACKQYTEITLINWKKSHLLTINDIYIYFLHVDTDFHLANYKPFFMQEVWKFASTETKGIFYFDPDITIKTNWLFFEDWVSFGVSLVHEITANDMPMTHPIRQKWIKIIESSNRQVRQHLTSYINSGFCGVSRENSSFINEWADIMRLAISEYGLAHNDFSHEQNRINPFFAKDQDALNIAAMCTDKPISEYGPEAMDFIYGGKIMSHAIGSPKPWSKFFFLSTIKGNPPTMAEKQYWKNVDHLIKPYTKFEVIYKNVVITIASFIGRFYRKY